MADQFIIESTCVTFIDDKLWPVFVFPDHSVPDDFHRTRPSKTALPVLVIGKHSLIWRQRNELLEYAPFDPYVDPLDASHSKDEQARQYAFREAQEFHGMDYYHHLIMDKCQRFKEQKRLETQVAMAKAGGAIPLLDSDDDDDDEPFKVAQPKVQNTVFLSDEEDTMPTPRSKKRPLPTKFVKHASLVTPSPTPKKFRKFPPAPLFFQQGNKADNDDELPSPSTFTPTKGPDSTWRANGKRSKIGDNDYVTKKQIELLMIQKGDGQPEPVAEVVPVKDPLKVNIYVGDDEKLFILDRATIAKYPSFTEHITGSDEVGYDISAATFDKIPSKTFESVVSWLKTRDYTPRLIGGKEPHLENVKSMSQYEEAAEQASLLWNVAHKLDLQGLQQLIFRKLQVQSPLAPNSLLMMTRMVFWNKATGTEVDEKMREMLRKEVAARFHECMDEEGLLLNRVIKADEELANYIWRYRLDNPWKEPEEFFSEDEVVEEMDEEDESYE